MTNISDLGQNMINSCNRPMLDAGTFSIHLQPLTMNSERWATDDVVGKCTGHSVGSIVHNYTQLAILYAVHFWQRALLFGLWVPSQLRVSRGTCVQAPELHAINTSLGHSAPSATERTKDFCPSRGTRVGDEKKVTASQEEEQRYSDE